VAVGGTRKFACEYPGFFGMANFQVATHKIGVRMRFQNGHNAGIVQVSVFVVRARVAGRVNYGNLALAHYYVGEMRQPFILELLYYHGE
jgi:hypothetical protein